MMRHLLLTGLVGGVLAGGALAAEPKGMFAQFLGVNQGYPKPEGPDRYLTSYRQDLPWGDLQPEGPGKWNEPYLADWGKAVLEHRKFGAERMPVLLYTTGWAARKKAWSFTVAGKRYDVQAWAPGQDVNTRQATVTDLATGKVENSKLDAGRMPPERVGDWEAYVERVVSFLSRPPYNVRYFQIWNEANDVGLTGFWNGTMDDYMETIHLPAAKIIRRHGGKVVYGGYPCNGSMEHYLGILDKHRAWDTLDVLDIHYFPLSAWQCLYDRVSRDKRRLAIWQTEVGFVPTPIWVPNNYPRFFHWAISHDWKPDRYKFFQFASWSPDDPKAYGYNCNFYRGETLTFHGKALMTLGGLLEAPVVKPYTAWETWPRVKTEIDEGKSSVEGFDCGDRIVLAIHLADQNGAAMFTDWANGGDSLPMDSPEAKLEVQFPKLKPAAIKAVWKVGVYGSKAPLAVKPGAGGKGVVVEVPPFDRDPVERQDNRDGRMHTFYLLVEKAGR